MAAIDSIAKALASAGLGEAEKEALISFSDGTQRKLNTKEDAEEVARTIENAPRMTALELRGNTVGVEAGERIAQALEKHPEFQRALWSDMFTGRLKTEIPSILRSLCNSMMAANVHLTELDLSDNAFGPIGAEGIEHFLRSPSAFSLEALKLNNNGLGGGGKVIAQALLDCHSNSTAAGHPLKLKVFVAGRNRLENPGAIALAAAFAMIGTLEEVSIPQNGIYHKGVTALARAFRKNKNLRVLNLSDNTFTVKGATAVAKVLPALTNLEVINFSDCLCRDEGTKLLVTAIGAEHKSLKEMNLSGNEIGPDVAKLVLQQFAGNPTLSVTLHGNNFGSRFSEIQNVANESTFAVDVGIESDDEGSLSSGDEDGEAKSASEEGSGTDSGSVSDNEASEPSFTESAGEDGVIKNGHTRAELDSAQSFHAFMENPSLPALEALGPNPRLILLAHLQDEISDRNPDAVARVIINLGAIVTASNESESLSQVVPCADAILREAESIAMAPLSPITQIINNLLARIGVVKTDSSTVERPNNLHGLLRLLGELVDKGHFAAQLSTLQYFFGQHVKKEYPQHTVEIGAFMKQIDSAMSEWDKA